MPSSLRPPRHDGLLARAFKNVTDPRDRNAVRHDLPAILSLAVTGVLAGCSSLMASGEHTTDLTADDLEALGPPPGEDPGLEGGPGRLAGRALPRAAGATRRQGRRGIQMGGLPAAAQVLQVRHTRTTKDRRSWRP